MSYIIFVILFLLFKEYLTEQITILIYYNIILYTRHVGIGIVYTLIYVYNLWFLMWIIKLV